MATVQILYFAWLRDRIGRAEERVDLPAGVGTVGAVLSWLQAREPVFAVLAGEGRTIRVAVNQEFASPDDPVGPGDEIALFPPVTGG
jgi:molybdopterin synthase sulfur carrier subunit